MRKSPMRLTRSFLMTSGQLQLSQDFHGFNENAEPLYAVDVAVNKALLSERNSNSAAKPAICSTMTSGQLQLSQDFHGFNENAEPLYAVDVAVNKVLLSERNSNSAACMALEPCSD